jgi:hypothetical protein
MPILRHTSSTDVPNSCCCNAYAICSSVKRDFFTACSFGCRIIHAEYATLERDYLSGGDQKGLNRTFAPYSVLGASVIQRASGETGEICLHLERKKPTDLAVAGEIQSLEDWRRKRGYSAPQHLRPIHCLNNSYQSLLFLGINILRTMLVESLRRSRTNLQAIVIPGSSFHACEMHLFRR